MHQDGTKTATANSNTASTNEHYIGKVDTGFGLSNADKTFNGSVAKLSATSTTLTNTTMAYTARPTNTSVLYCIATKDIYVDARYDYRLTEKVVGTWIDGKPLYQKTVETGGNVPSGATLVERIVQTSYDTIRYTKSS